MPYHSIPQTVRCVCVCVFKHLHMHSACRTRKVLCMPYLSPMADRIIHMRKLTCTLSPNGAHAAPPVHYTGMHARIPIQHMRACTHAHAIYIYAKTSKRAANLYSSSMIRSGLMIRRLKNGKIRLQTAEGWVRLDTFARLLQTNPDRSIADVFFYPSFV